MYQHVADIVHVREAIDMTVIIDVTECLAQLFQRIRPKGAEHEQTAGLQDPAHFGKCLFDVIAPLQRQVGPHETRTRIRQRYLLYVTHYITGLMPTLISDSPQQLPPPGYRRPGLQMHCRRNVDRQQAGRRIAHE